MRRYFFNEALVLNELIVLNTQTSSKRAPSSLTSDYVHNEKPRPLARPLVPNEPLSSPQPLKWLTSNSSLNEPLCVSQVCSMGTRAWSWIMRAERCTAGWGRCSPAGAASSRGSSPEETASLVLLQVSLSTTHRRTHTGAHTQARTHRRTHTGAHTEAHTQASQAHILGNVWSSNSHS